MQFVSLGKCCCLSSSDEGLTPKAFVNYASIFFENFTKAEVALFEQFSGIFPEKKILPLQIQKIT